MSECKHCGQWGGYHFIWCTRPVPTFVGTTTTTTHPHTNRNTMNENFQEATKLLADNPGEYEIEKSKALATLALAHEQRTANLLAVFFGDGAISDANYTKLADILKERLGL